MIRVTQSADGRIRPKPRKSDFPFGTLSMVPLCMKIIFSVITLGQTKTQVLRDAQLVSVIGKPSSDGGNLHVKGFQKLEVGRLDSGSSVPFLASSGLSLPIDLNIF